MSGFGPPTTGGRGGGRGRQRGGRGGGRGGRRGQRDRRPPRFEGRTEELKGFIYDHTGEKNPKQFIDTTREIANYVGRTATKNPGDFTEAIENLNLPSPTEPAEPANDNNKIEFEKWKADFKDWRELEKEHTTFLSKLYQIVFGQCSESMRDKLRSHSKYPSANQDGIELLKLIRQILYTYEDTQKIADSICHIKERFYTLKQRNNQSLQDYYESFLSHVEVMESLDISLADSKVAEEFALAADPPRTVATEADKRAAHKQAIAIRFIHGLAPMYGEYQANLRNAYLDGVDNYPSTIDSAYTNVSHRQLLHGTVQVDSDVAFATDGSTLVPGTDGVVHSHITCYRCEVPGHFASHCPRVNAPAADGDANANDAETTDDADPE